MSIRIPAAFDLSDPPPVDFGWVSVLLVAGHHAALATDALRHVEVKAILFAWFRKALGDSGDGCQWFDFVQGLLGRLLPLLAQDKPDAIVFRPFDER
jgi:hypothetical protein